MGAMVSLVADEFPAQRASNTENVSIWWCHHEAIIRRRADWLSMESFISATAATTLEVHKALLWRHNEHNNVSNH